MVGAPLGADDDGERRDLAHEIDGLIGRVRAEAPRASIAEIANSLIAAYCPVVAQMTTISVQEKWLLMRQFDRVLMQQLSATAMPQDSLIVVNVPLSPAIYESGESARAADHRLHC